jgi:hypothetical protein
MALSPAHPLAVYGYLADTCGFLLIGPRTTVQEEELKAFLTTPAQVARYREELLEDVKDVNSGKLFVIVRTLEGTLKQEPVRTLNGFLPESLPLSMSSWLDRKEIPFLQDEVAIWLGGSAIVARGHYHSFGGTPSKGDSWAQFLSDAPEIVVTNGLIPSIFLNGRLVPYGHDVRISERVFRALRSLEDGLLIGVTGEYHFPEEPTENLKSFLGFLEDYRGVDISSTDEIRDAIGQLHTEFVCAYRDVFPAHSSGKAYNQENADFRDFFYRIAQFDQWVIGYDTLGRERLLTAYSSDCSHTIGRAPVVHPEG